MPTAIRRNTLKHTPVRTNPLSTPETMMQRILVVSFILLFAGVPTSAQGIAEAAMENLYARPGHPTMVIYVLGDVEITGRWRVEREVQLLDLLAVARPSVVMTEGSQTVEDVRVKVFREADQGRRLAFDEPMESLLTSVHASLVLAEGDVVVVDLIEKQVSTTVGFREILAIATSVASLVLTAVALATR